MYSINIFSARTRTSTCTDSTTSGFRAQSNLHFVAEGDCLDSLGMKDVNPPYPYCKRGDNIKVWLRTVPAPVVMNCNISDDSDG